MEPGHPRGRTPLPADSRQQERELPASPYRKEPEYWGERMCYFLLFSGTTCTSYNVLKSPS
jgi:hypothetical protein